MLFYLVGAANIALQPLTKNISFAIFGIVCMFISALSLVPKFKRIALMTRFVLLFSVISYCLYYHHLYGCYIADYIVITIEAVFCIALSIIYAIPKKEPPSIEGGSVSFKGQVGFEVHPKSFPYAPQIELLHTLKGLIC